MTADGTRTYNWSAENLPTSIVSGGVTESYQYDAEGERVKKTRSPTYMETTWAAYR